jgi:hypothetical protein
LGVKDLFELIGVDQDRPARHGRDLRSDLSQAAYPQLLEPFAHIVHSYRPARVFRFNESPGEALEG